MQVGNVTTPFGRRPVSYAMLKHQMDATEIEDGASVDKWKVYRALCEARPRLAVTDRALAVLNALLSFYPKNELCAGDSLVVFPSNAQLSLRAHGMAEQTIRRHIAALIDAGLLIRKDSANGKRFAKRSREGEINDAFGFSLAPLLARWEEIERVAAEVEAERLHFSRMRERLTICRRDVFKLIATGIEEGAPGDWNSAEAEYKTILSVLPRKPDAVSVAKALDDMEFLRESVINQLETQLKTQNPSGSPYQNERHKQNSNTESLNELEPRNEKAQAEMPAPEAKSATPEPLDGVATGNAEANSLGADRGMPARNRTSREDLKAFPLGMVLSACPQISDYGPGGQIANWRELMSAAVVVRSMLGVSPSAYQDACEAMGPENAATAIACILERAGHINSAGGYLRDLTRRTQKGEFSLGPMLMAQMRANGHESLKTG